MKLMIPDNAYNCTYILFAKEKGGATRKREKDGGKLTSQGHNGSWSNMLGVFSETKSPQKTATTRRLF